MPIVQDRRLPAGAEWAEATTSGAAEFEETDGDGHEGRIGRRGQRAGGVRM